MAGRKVLVVYYSEGGNTKKMAEAIAEAIQSSGLEVTLDVKSPERIKATVLHHKRQSGFELGAGKEANWTAPRTP